MGTSREIVFRGDKSYDGHRLSEIWDREVKNEKIAWYVDHFTEDAEQFGVRYLIPDLRMTNENKDQRDPNDKEGSQWGSDDVAEWFGKDDILHTYTFVFQIPDISEVFGIHCEPRRVFPFGPRALSLPVANLWDEYIEHGVNGPLKACMVTDNSKLVAIVQNPTWATIEKYGLGQDFMLTLAGILDQ